MEILFIIIFILILFIIFLCQMNFNIIRIKLENIEKLINDRKTGS